MHKYLQVSTLLLAALLAGFCGHVPAQAQNQSTPTERRSPHSRAADRYELPPKVLADMPWLLPSRMRRPELQRALEQSTQANALPQSAAANSRAAQLAASCLNEDWVARYAEPGGSFDVAKDVAVDGSGNVYVTGFVSASAATDYLTIKYDATGVQQWPAYYNGPASDYDAAARIAVDGSGNVYVTGSSYNAGGNSDFATVKYDADGVELWAARYNGPANNADGAIALAVDGSGNVYVAGNSYNASGNSDYLTLMYNSAGAPQWEARYDGTGNDFDLLMALAVDGSGNVYVTGRSLNVDGNYDYATLKYNDAGVQQWLAPYNGPDDLEDNGAALAVDGSGNVYVTGTSANAGGGWDYATLKYDASGAPLWEARYNGPANGSKEARALALDATGHVYVTGDAFTGVDFDYATVKYNGNNGTQLWAKLYNGPANSTDAAYDLAVDGSDVYVTGYSYDAGGYSDYATVKYNAGGVEQCAVRYNGPANSDDDANALAIDAGGNVYVTGRSYDLDVDYATVKYSQIISPNTPAGTDIGVSPNDVTSGNTPVTLTFDEVTAAGNTSLITDDSGPTAPGGFLLGDPPVYYDLSTTATFAGNIQICIDYTGVAFTNEAAIQLYHFEGGAWVQITTSHDQTNDVICGIVTSLSPFAIFEPEEIAVTMDIKPGSYPNSINPKSKGVIPVAILTTASFDATTVDPLSVKFGPNGATESHRKGHLEDADGDGDTDLVLHFKTPETGIQCGDTQAGLTGQTAGGQAIAGSDAIQTVGCGTGKSLAEEEAGIPAEYALLQNYPNPFNPDTKIVFHIKEAGTVRLSIYNLNGQEIRTLLSELVDPGNYSIPWDGKDNANKIVPSGIYLYKLSVNGFEQTKKMTFMK